MDVYLKSVVIAVIGVLLCLILSKKAKDYAVVIIIALCCALCAVAIGFLKPILQLMEQLSRMVDSRSGWLKILLKTAGLSIIGETVSLICADAGLASVGKMLQLLTTVVILWISLPLVQNLMDLIGSILEML